MSAGNIGTISRISGPVVDVHFPEHSSVPDIFHAVEVTINGAFMCLNACSSSETARCAASPMRPTDGMSRGMEAVDTGRADLRSGERGNAWPHDQRHRRAD